MDIKLLINHVPESSNNRTELDRDCSVKRNLQELPIVTKRQKLNEEDEYDDEAFSSVISSRRSTATSISSINSDNSSDFSPKQDYSIYEQKSMIEPLSLDSIDPHIEHVEDLHKILKANSSIPLSLNKISFKDPFLPKYDNIKDTQDENIMRQDLLDKIQQRYVDPLLELTGYKWVRKEVPSKGKGLKIFSVKYLCSQQKIDLKKNSDRSRQLTHPLKQFNCQSSYLLKYVWSKQTIEISYNHIHHPPYKRLPDELKPFILERLDKKALDLYNEIMNEPKFNSIKHLIFFSKVQSFWSKERTKKKDETTKLAFKNFFES